MKTETFFNFIIGALVVVGLFWALPLAWRRIKASRAANLPAAERRVPEEDRNQT